MAELIRHEIRLAGQVLMGGRGVDDEAWLTPELVQGSSDFLVSKNEVNNK